MKVGTRHGDAVPSAVSLSRQRSFILGKYVYRGIPVGVVFEMYVDVFFDKHAGVFF